jgi:hypothetical protein
MTTTAPHDDAQSDAGQPDPDNTRRGFLQRTGSGVAPMLIATASAKAHGSPIEQVFDQEAPRCGRGCAGARGQPEVPRGKLPRIPLN